MRQRLSLPKLPRWATDTARRNEPSEGRKDTGIELDDVIPARLMNWLWGLGFNWNQKMQHSVVGCTVQSPLSFVKAFCNLLVKHPEDDIWVAITGTNFTSDMTDLEVSENGLQWANVETLASGQFTGLCVDSTSFLAAATDAGNALWVSTDGNVWAQSTYAHGIAAPIGVESAAPDSNRLIVYSGLATKIATSSGSNDWASPTTEIDWGTTEAILRVRHHKDDNWFAVTKNTGVSNHFHTSKNNGDTWVKKGTEPYPFDDIWDTDSNDVSGRVIIAGYSGSTLVLARSDDFGDNWTSTNIAFASIPTHDAKKSTLYHLGEGAWVCLGSFITASGHAITAVYSVDDGVTWHNVVIDATDAATLSLSPITVGVGRDRYVVTTYDGVLKSPFTGEPAGD